MGKNYMQVARALIRDLEALNRVHFGKESCDLVFKHIQERDNTWIAEIERLESELGQLERDYAALESRIEHMGEDA